MLLAVHRSEVAEALNPLLEGEATGEAVEWLERQLRSLLRELDAMILDLDSGLTIADLGFSEDDFADLVDDLGLQIANLLMLIRRARERGR